MAALSKRELREARCGDDLAADASGLNVRRLQNSGEMRWSGVSASPPLGSPRSRSAVPRQPIGARERNSGYSRQAQPNDPRPQDWDAGLRLG